VLELRRPLVPPHCLEPLERAPLTHNEISQFATMHELAIGTKPEARLIMSEEHGKLQSFTDHGNNPYGLEKAKRLARKSKAEEN
jgi:hypothetical protein